MSPIAENQYDGRTIQKRPFFTQSITTTDELHQTIRNRLAQLETRGPLAASKVAFQLIQHARITPVVFQELRSR
jgi:hypothetical protein